MAHPPTPCSLLLSRYGVVLGSMLNLPLWMRHMSDYIMLVALFQSKFMKDNGGLMRLLTGTDTDGKVHSDGMTLAAELCLSHGGGAAIQLPSDTPGAEPEAWCLRIFVLFFSLDWLAHGDFGPFSGAVSARHPCFKCKWTSTCACSYLQRNKHNTVTHSEHCLGRIPHTHADVMREVQVQREWAGSVTDLKASYPPLSLPPPPTPALLPLTLLPKPHTPPPTGAPHGHGHLPPILSGRVPDQRCRRGRHPRHYAHLPVRRCALFACVCDRHLYSLADQLACSQQCPPGPHI